MLEMKRWLLSSICGSDCLLLHIHDVITVVYLLCHHYQRKTKIQGMNQDMIGIVIIYSI